jgi:hypothetical protein
VIAEHTAKEDQWWRVTAEVYRLARWLDDSKIHNHARLVLAGNELRNSRLFGLRTTRNGFVGLLVVVIPLPLQKSVTADRAARAALTSNAVRVIGYDLPWTCALWRRNHASHLPVAMTSKLVERPPLGCDGLSAAEALILFSNVPTRVAPIRQLVLRQKAANQGYRSD